MALPVPKSRKGTLPIGIDTLMKRAQADGFLLELSKLAVSDDEALEAAKLLSQDTRSRVRKYVDAGVVGGTASPMIDAVGSAVKGAVDAKPGMRRAGALAGARLTKGDIAKSVVRGALGGTAIQAGREGFQMQRAKDTYRQFMREHEAG